MLFHSQSSQVSKYAKIFLHLQKSLLDCLNFVTQKVKIHSALEKGLEKVIRTPMMSIRVGPIRAKLSDQKVGQIWRVV